MLLTAFYVYYADFDDRRTILFHIAFFSKILNKTQSEAAQIQSKQTDACKCGEWQELSKK